MAKTGGSGLAGALFGALLWLYPPHFRREFGDEMRAVFADALAQAALGGWWAAAAFAVREWVTLPRLAAQQHWRTAQAAAKDGVAGMSKTWRFILYLLLALALVLPGVALMLYGWSAAGMGTFLPILLVALAALGLALVPVMVVASQRLGWRVWLAVGLFVLAVLALPAEVGFQGGGALAWHAWFMPSAGLLAVGLLVLAAARFVAAEPRGRIAAAACLAVAGLLLARTLHYQYWLVVWDSTYDPLTFIWMGLPILAALFAGLFVIAAWPGNRRWSWLYVVIVPALLLGVYVQAQRVDFRQLTEQRAARVGQAIETFFARQGRYPTSLAQVRPWYAAHLPGPVIMAGQDWCYWSDSASYQLGYVYRAHWSDPRLEGRLAAQGGVAGDPTALCADEIAALRRADPGYYGAASPTPNNTGGATQP